MYPQFLREAGYYCTNNSKQDYQFNAPVTAWDVSSRQAHYKNRAEGQSFFAQADEISYDESKGLYVLRSKGRDSILTREKQRGGKRAVKGGGLSFYKKVEEFAADDDEMAACAPSLPPSTSSRTSPARRIATRSDRT